MLAKGYWFAIHASDRAAELLAEIDALRSALSESNRMVLDLRDAISAESVDVEHSCSIARRTRIALDAERSENAQLTAELDQAKEDLAAAKLRENRAWEELATADASEFMRGQEAARAALRSERDQAVERERAAVAAGERRGEARETRRWSRCCACGDVLLVAYPRCERHVHTEPGDPEWVMEDEDGELCDCDERAEHVQSKESGNG